jgi:hypothetical protein
VIDHLAEAPLVRRIAVKGLFLADAAQERKRFVQLEREHAEDVVALDAVDVGEVIGCGFSGFRESSHVTSLPEGLSLPDSRRRRRGRLFRALLVRQPQKAPLLRLELLLGEDPVVDEPT